MGSRQHLDGLARSARSLQDTVGELHAALTAGNERRAGYARDRLAEQARAALGETGSYGFERSRPGSHTPDPDPDDLLAEAVHDLALSQALISAAADVGETDAGEGATRDGGGGGGAGSESGRLRVAGDSLGRLATALKPPDRFGFEAAASASPDLPTAIATLRQEAASCLDRIHERSAGVAGAALAKIPGVSTITTTAQEILDKLGVGALTGTLTKLAARALHKALTALHRLIPMEALDRVNTAVSQLADGLDKDKAAGPLLMSALLGTEGVRSALDERLARDALDRARLDGARTELAELGDRFGKHMDVLAIAITVSTAVVAWLATPLAAGAVAALLLGAVLVLAADYADAWSLPVAVRGVRTVVEDATA
ncbi:hypothetical protein [Nonomuraea endophytica]|uniref:Uncharacterized protein n=1 Tax=Nonomuraea endophytica TaxID=714136 RepID=A0A7W8EH66_9ACTN|nr:hypothetical protein [Nonomuraea endophytica]MBB5078237.1 hypothetical protein [Nonomuraea endophytica]